MDQVVSGLGGLFTLLAAAALYVLPWLIAISRNHHQRSAICVLNLFLGWTALGWIAALIWSVTAVQSPAPVENVSRVRARK